MSPTALGRPLSPSFHTYEPDEVPDEFGAMGRMGCNAVVGRANEVPRTRIRCLLAHALPCSHVPLSHSSVLELVS